MQSVLKKREKIILYVTIGIIFFGVVFNFVIAPVLGKYDAINKEANLNRIKLKKYLMLLAQKDQIQKKYGKFSSNLELATDTKDNLVATMATLENIAKTAGIRIVDIRPQAVPRGDAVIVDLRTEGTVEQYTKFIYDVETSLLLLKVKRLQLTAKPNMTTLEGLFTISQPVISK